MSNASQALAQLAPAADTVQVGGNVVVAGPQTTADVAQNTQAAVLANMYNQSAYNALTCKGGSVQALNLETRFLQQTENRNPQFDIVNADAADQRVIISSQLGLAGAYAFYNQSPSGFDSPNMSDQFGVNMRALQGFNSLVNHNNVLLVILQMISSNLTQLAQPFTYADLAYDAQLNGVAMNTTATFSRYDTNQNLVKLGGIWTLGDQTLVYVTSKAGQSMSITLTLASTASVKAFRPIS